MTINKAKPVKPLNPETNVAVSASAGAGKTYLLVNRIISLLIADVDPASILAITFTRKAANEMLDRVQSRLWYLHNCDENELKKILQTEFELDITAELMSHVRQLYQKILFAEPGLKISTFHAFCQDLLQYFALDADLPPAFELTEQTYLIADAAWDKLFNDISQQQNHPLRPAIDCLFEQLGSLFNTRAALIDGFLEYRSDWWSFTDNQEKSVAYATQVARDFFKPTEHNPEDIFLDTYKSQLITFSKRIQNLPQKIYQQLAQAVSLAFDINTPRADAFNIIKNAFLTAKNEISKSIKYSQALEKKLGNDTEVMLKEYATLATAIIDTLDLSKRNRLYHLHKSWYQVGDTLLTNYQSIKRSKHQLDFSDLEWLSYKLLNKADNAQWIQYKLDSRINHLLIDEFQDTNSTQWQMLLPLLEEMASGNTERQRSVFLVGDSKQSIYGFRRANPELQQTATQWLQSKLHAEIYPLNKSWRSSSAIMQAVNHVFSHQELIADFSEHDTHQQDLWGRVECWSLFKTSEDEKDEDIFFRNPLKAPPDTTSISAHDLEGIAIAEKIASLVSSQIAVGDKHRRLEYKDIFILLRKRSHAGAYEKALADKNIPFTGTETGTLLDCQEVDDIICLLNFLVTPFDNMALAQLIKSPIFNGTDDDLIQLAEVQQGNWFEKLQHLCKSGVDNTVLHDALEKLNSWSDKQHVLPVHDLLNIIYSEGDIIERYKAAMPNTLKSRASANLYYLLELALNTDSGRYPSIMRFLQHIQKLKSAKDNQKPDSLREYENQNRVQIMTIHAAKGLEAPVVFLADTHIDGSSHNTYSCFANWPTTDSKVKHFFLLPKKSDTPKCLFNLTESAEKKNIREDNNLLYVAMTRAIHMLFISGTENDRAKNSWYNKIQSALPDNNIIYGKPVKAAEKIIKATDKQRKHLSTVTTSQPDRRFINPSMEDKIHPLNVPAKGSGLSEDMAIQRGIFIHHILYCLAEDKRVAYPASFKANEVDKKILIQWEEEANRLINHPDFMYLYNKDKFDNAYNETPILLKTDKGLVNGIIDRLVITKDSAIIIDYKTQLVDDNKALAEIANTYQTQMLYYKESIKKLFPNKICKCLIVFTYSRLSYEIA